MATPNDDDRAAGEALIRELVAASPGEEGEALDGVWDCHERLREQERYEDALRLLDGLLGWQLGHESDGDPDAAEELAYTMLGRAATLRDLDRYAEAVTQCDDLLRRYEKDFDYATSDLKGCIGNALFFKGDSLLGLKRWLEALAALDKLVAQEHAVPTDARRWVGYALQGRGHALTGLGDEAGALDAFSEGIAALDDDDDPEVVGSAEAMMCDRARMLANVGRTDEAIAVFDALIARPDPVAPLRVAIAFLEKEQLLVGRLDTEAIIANADAAVQRFGSSDDARLRLCAAHFLEAKVTALKAQGRKDAAAFAAEQLVERFGADLDPRIETIVAPHAHRIGRGRSRLRFRGLG
jgi:tetratricopeptide (TPR) repeat protein